LRHQVFLIHHAAHDRELYLFRRARYVIDVALAKDNKSVMHSVTELFCAISKVLDFSRGLHCGFREFLDLYGKVAHTSCFIQFRWI